MSAPEFSVDVFQNEYLPAGAREAVILTRAWMTDHHPGALWMRRLDSGLHLVDSRREKAPAPRRAVLNGWKAAVYLACDRSQQLAALKALPEIEHSGVSCDELVAFLERAASLHFMIDINGRWLSLAVHTPARPLEPSRFVSLPLTVSKAPRAAGRSPSRSSDAAREQMI
jgi:hypothetical protein